MKRPVAIVGCGRMGRIRARACREIGVDSIMLTDVDLSRATNLATEIGGADVLMASENLPWGQLKALFICVPPADRGRLEMTAIERGIPFFVEKPVGLSVDQMLPTMRQLAVRPVVNAVGYMNRYRESVAAVRSALADRKLIGFTARWVNGIYSVPWWRQPHLSGGSLNEQATHFIDLTRYLIGEIAEVAVTAHPHPDHPAVIGAAAVHLTAANGISGAFFYSCEATYKSIDYRVFTTTQEFVMEGWDMAVTLPEAIARRPINDRDAIFVTETRAFFDAVDGAKAAVLSDLFDALETQAVSDALAKAAATGQSVPVQSIASRLR